MSPEPARGVSFHERQYDDGRDIELLDIVDVPLLRHVPKDHQSENWLLDPDRYWVRRGQLRWTDLSRLARSEGGLWGNGCHSTDGINDRIPEGKAARQSNSLALIYVNRLELEVSFHYGKSTVRGRFQFDGTEYGLRVTDPAIESHFDESGNYSLRKCHITVSLAEPWNDFCYKLIAAVIPRNSLATP